VLKAGPLLPLQKYSTNHVWKIQKKYVRIVHIIIYKHVKFELQQKGIDRTTTKNQHMNSCGSDMNTHIPQQLTPILFFPPLRLVQVLFATLILHDFTNVLMCFFTCGSM
jgi:hypothetical protein